MHGAVIHAQYRSARFSVSPPLSLLLSSMCVSVSCGLALIARDLKTYSSPVHLFFLEIARLDGETVWNQPFFSHSTENSLLVQPTDTTQEARLLITTAFSLTSSVPFHSCLQAL